MWIIHYCNNNYIITIFVWSRGFPVRVWGCQRLCPIKIWHCNKAEQVNTTMQHRFTRNYSQLWLYTLLEWLKGVYTIWKSSVLKYVNNSQRKLKNVFTKLVETGGLQVYCTPLICIKCIQSNCEYLCVG